MERVKPSCHRHSQEIYSSMKGQAFILEYIEELVRVEDQLRKKQGE